MKPLELIEMLEKWELEEEFEVLVQNNPESVGRPIVVLAQGSNTINLSSEYR